MKGINYLSEHIYVAKTESKGRGVFTKAALKKNTLIEIAPVIVMSGIERKLLDQTLLHDYIFEWGEKGQQCCMALGYVPIYNHSYQSNCEYEMHFKQQVIKIKTVRDVAAGEELFINYNGDWDNDKSVWFEARPPSDIPR